MVHNRIKEVRLFAVGSVPLIAPKTLDRPDIRESAGVLHTRTHGHERLPVGWKFRFFPVGLARRIVPKTLDRPGTRESADVARSRTHGHERLPIR